MSLPAGTFPDKLWMTAMVVGEPGPGGCEDEACESRSGLASSSTAIIDANIPSAMPPIEPGKRGGSIGESMAGKDLGPCWDFGSGWDSGRWDSGSLASMLSAIDAQAS